MEEQIVDVLSEWEIHYLSPLLHDERQLQGTSSSWLEGLRKGVICSLGCYSDAHIALRRFLFTVFLIYLMNLARSRQRR